jgi:hypothetical protein
MLKYLLQRQKKLDPSPPPSKKERGKTKKKEEVQNSEISLKNSIFLRMIINKIQHRSPSSSSTTTTTRIVVTYTFVTLFMTARGI